MGRVFWAALLPASLLLAQEAAQLPPQRDFRLPPRIGIVNQTDMTLDAVLALALSNNRDIDLSRISQAQANYAVESAAGVFDPRWGATLSFQRNIQPIASSLGGSATGAVTNKTALFDPRFSGVLPWLGASYQADLSSQRSDTNNTFTQLNPTYPTALNFGFTLPLLRNLRTDNNRRGLEVAKRNVALTDEQFRQRVMETVTRAEQAYWNLTFAYNNLEIQLEAVRLGREQDESNRRQEREGLLAPIDVVAAQRQLATFEVNALSAQEALATAENALKQVILGDRGDPMWSTAIRPVTPVNVSPPVVPLLDAVNQALSRRPELAQARISRDINALNRRYAEDQTKPQMDLVLSHTNAGLAGAQLPAAPNPFTAGLAGLTTRLNQLSTIAGLQPLPDVGGGSGNVLPGQLIGGYGQSLSNLFGSNFPTTQVQLRIELPLKNRTAEANLQTAVAEGRRIESQRAQTEVAIEAGVRNAMQSIESARARLDSARVARNSAEQQYESEQRQFRAGTSTLFLVQQRQTDMVTARSQERRAEADLGNAIASFELATGGILDAHSITLR